MINKVLNHEGVYIKNTIFNDFIVACFHTKHLTIFPLFLSFSPPFPLRDIARPAAQSDPLIAASCVNAEKATKENAGNAKNTSAGNAKSVQVALLGCAKIALASTVRTARSANKSAALTWRTAPAESKSARSVPARTDHVAADARR